MVATRRSLEEQIVDFSHRLHQRGWVANHDGNLTVRLAEGRFLATPTSVSKADVDRQNLIVVDGDGLVVSGGGKPFSELALHLYIFRQRPDVMAIIHAHPTTATGFSVAGIELRTAMMPEPVVSLGAKIPLVPYAAPKTPEWTANMAAHVVDADTVLLEHHGVFSFGPDLETAFLRMELTEHLAKIQLAAHQAGLVREIPEAHVQALLGARTKAGIGQAARESVAAPEPEDKSKRRRGRRDTSEPEVRTVVREEITRALRK
jgi:L-fuculose-phosphate aldolase